MQANATSSPTYKIGLTFWLMACLFIAGCGGGGNSGNHSPIASAIPVVTIPVNNAAELLTALTNAKGGELISCATGNYGALSLNGTAYSYATPVTIKSANTSSSATFSSLYFKNGASNLVVDSVAINYTLPPTDTSIDVPAVYVSKASKITLRNSVLVGSLVKVGDAVTLTVAPATAPLGFVGTGAGRGISVASSQDVLVENNLLSQFRNGMVFNESDRVTVRGNEAYSIRTDMLDMSGVLDMLIENNHFHDHRQPFRECFRFAHRRTGDLYLGLR